MRDVLGRVRVHAASPQVDGDPGRVLRQGEDLLVTVTGGRQFRIPISAAQATVAVATIDITAPGLDGAVRLDFTGGQALRANNDRELVYMRAAEAGFVDVVSALDAGGAKVEQTRLTKAQAVVQRGAKVWIVAPCFAAIEMVMFAMPPTLAGEALVGTTRIPYPYSVLTTVFLVAFGVAALVAMPSAAMVRTMVSRPKTALGRIEDLTGRLEGAHAAYMLGFLPLGRLKPADNGKVYSVILGRPLWRLVAIGAVMIAIGVASYWEAKYGNRDARLAAMVGRALIMMMVVVGYLLPGAEPVATTAERARRQLVARRWWLGVLLAAFAGGLVVVAIFPL